jgi:hypothetical protein
MSWVRHLPWMVHGSSGRWRRMQLEICIQVFFTLMVFRGEWSESCPGRVLHPQWALDPRCTEGWLGLWTGLDIVQESKHLKVPELELRPLGLSVRSQSPYRLRYRGSSDEVKAIPIAGCGGPYVCFLRGTNIICVRFEVFTVVTMKNVVFWDIETQFLLHRRHIMSPLQSPTG